MTHDPDPIWPRWREVDDLFELLLETPPEERDALLARSCGDDVELLDAVQSLLVLTSQASNLDVAPGDELLRAVWSDGPAEEDLSGMRVGRYVLEEEVGRGGMATVYSAERADGAYHQKVAVKVLRRGLDTDRVIRRFIAERQILSGLEHPNIARLLDGGSTEDGRPYLVTEYVDGAPITEWADSERLSTERRLDLFDQVLAAVGEAHRRLVVHRDLKPSNVLVDGEGRVRLLDFGIAKLLDLDPDEAITEVGDAPLTRRYASPEQLRGEPVTVSTDVYQLGLLLHVLLTGLHPTGRHLSQPLSDRPPTLPSRALSGTSTEEESVLAQHRGTTPTALRQTLQGDLDVIVAKCLSPTVSDRYRSVEEIASDLRRHRDGRPIRARPAPWTLRLRKWTRRNRWAVPVAVVGVTGASIWASTIVVSQRQLRSERNQARAEAQRAELMRSFLVDLLETSDPFGDTGGSGGPEPSISDILVPAGERLQSELATEPALQADLLTTVASILYGRQGPSSSRSFVDSAVAIRQRNSLTNTPGYARDLETLATYVRAESPDSANELLERAIATLRTTTEPGDARLAHALAELQWLRINHTGVVDGAPGEEALAIYESAGPEHQIDLADVLGHLSYVYQEVGRPEEALAAADRAHEIMQGAFGNDHARTALAATKLGQLFGDQGRHEEAEPLLRASALTLEETAGRAHSQTLTVRNNLAVTLRAMGRHQDAVTELRALVEARQSADGETITRGLADNYQNLAASLKELGQYEEADSMSALAHTVYSRTTPEGHYLRGLPLLTRAEIQLLRDRPSTALETAREALRILEPALPDGHYATEVARCRLGIAQLLLGSSELGLTNIDSALVTLAEDDRAPEAYVTECRRAAESGSR